MQTNLQTLLHKAANLALPTHILSKQGEMTCVISVLTDGRLVPAVLSTEMNTNRSSAWGLPNVLSVLLALVGSMTVANVRRLLPLSRLSALAANHVGRESIVLTQPLSRNMVGISLYTAYDV